MRSENKNTWSRGYQIFSVEYVCVFFSLLNIYLAVVLFLSFLRRGSRSSFGKKTFRKTKKKTFSFQMAREKCKEDNLKRKKNSNTHTHIILVTRWNMIRCFFTGNNKKMVRAKREGEREGRKKSWFVIYVLSARKCVSVSKRHDNQLHVAMNIPEKNWERRKKTRQRREQARKKNQTIHGKASMMYIKINQLCRLCVTFWLRGCFVVIHIVWGRTLSKC